MIRVRYRRTLATILAMISVGASAQRAKENAITTATDAFVQDCANVRCTAVPMLALLSRLCVQIWEDLHYEIANLAWNRVRHNSPPILGICNQMAAS